MCSDDVYVTLLRSFYNNYLLTDLMFFPCLCFVANYIERHRSLQTREISNYLAIFFYFYPAEQPCKVIRVSESGKFLASGIRNPGIWNPEFSSKNPESL